MNLSDLFSFSSCRGNLSLLVQTKARMMESSIRETLLFICHPYCSNYSIFLADYHNVIDLLFRTKRV
jgi:hypothetical protein